MGKRDADVKRTQAALKMLREGRPLSQKQLAKLTGVPSGTLAQIETGRSLMSSEVAVKTARSLNTDPVSLLVATNVAAIKARIGRGDEGPGRARRLLVEIKDILEESDLTPEQERTLLDSAGELATLLESDAVAGAGETPEDRLERLEHATDARPGRRSRGTAATKSHAPERGDDPEPLDINTQLGRDSRGKKLPPEMAERRRAEKEAGIWDDPPESANKSRVSSAEAAGQLRMNDLGRDELGRKKGSF